MNKKFSVCIFGLLFIGVKAYGQIQPFELPPKTLEPEFLGQIYSSKNPSATFDLIIKAEKDKRKKAFWTYLKAYGLQKDRPKEEILLYLLNEDSNIRFPNKEFLKEFLPALTEKPLEARAALIEPGDLMKPLLCLELSYIYFKSPEFEKVPMRDQLYDPVKAESYLMQVLTMDSNVLGKKKKEYRLQAFLRLFMLYGFTNNLSKQCEVSNKLISEFPDERVFDWACVGTSSKMLGELGVLKSCDLSTVEKAKLYKEVLTYNSWKGTYFCGDGTSVASVQILAYQLLLQISDRDPTAATAILEEIVKDKKFYNDPDLNLILGDVLLKNKNKIGARKQYERAYATMEKGRNDEFDEKIELGSKGDFSWLKTEKDFPSDYYRDWQSFKFLCPK